MTAGVLVVEDEFLLRMDAVDFMGRCGFIMYEASNADEAIPLLELHDDIRAVFTDINMPGSIDGLKLAHYVRGRWPPIKLSYFWPAAAYGGGYAGGKRIHRQAV